MKTSKHIFWIEWNQYNDIQDTNIQFENRYRLTWNVQFPLPKWYKNWMGPFCTTPLSNKKIKPKSYSLFIYIHFKVITRNTHTNEDQMWNYRTSLTKHCKKWWVVQWVWRLPECFMDIHTNETTRVKFFFLHFVGTTNRYFQSQSLQFSR